MVSRLRLTIIFVLLLMPLGFPTEALAEAPEALFDVDVVAGIAPYTAHFTYMGDANEVDYFLWEFGDGTTSNEQNPAHTYAGSSPLRPIAKLTVTNSAGSSSAEIEMRVYPEGFIPKKTTYYIDATLGNDLSDGKSPESAKKSLDAITRPEAGDTILFKRGEVWEDPAAGALLIIRESGLEGAPITYGAYGNESDPKPVIKRQAQVPGWNNPANWTNLSFGEANSFDWGARISSLDRGPLNVRSFIPANYLSQDGTKIRIKVGGNYYHPVEIASAYIGQQAAAGDKYDMQPGTITQITFEGSSSTIVNDGGTQDSDWVNYNFDHTKTYIISLGIKSAAVGMYASAEYYESSCYRSGAGMELEAGKPDASSNYISLNAFWNLVGFAVDTDVPGAKSNVWYLDASFHDPQRVWLSGRESAVAHMRGRLNSDYSWIYVYSGNGNRLYVYSGGNPAEVFSNMEVAGLYGSPVTMSNRDYVIFQNLDLQGGRGNGLSINGGNNIIIEDCNIAKDSGTHGLRIAFSSSGRSSNHGIVRRNVIDADNHVANYWHAETTDDGLYFAEGANYWVAYDNIVSGWAHTGIVIGTLSNRYKTTNNNVYNNFVTCPDIEYGRGSAFYGEKEVYYENRFHHNVILNTKCRSQIQAHGIDFYNNIIDGVSCQIRPDISQGMMIYRPYDADTFNIKVYNNIFANTDGAGLEFSNNNIHTTYYDNIISNNIFYNTGRNNNTFIYATGTPVPAQDFQFIINEMPEYMRDNLYQNNIFYKPTGNNLIFYGSDPADKYIETVMGFNAMNGTGGDIITGNIESDPLFVDPDDPLGPDGVPFTHDDGFRLQSGSLAIDAGIDVGLAYSGNAPDIGAYEYVPPEAEVVYGDVSGDGEISAYDAALAAQAVVGLVTMTSDQARAADVSGDGETGAYDAALIAQRAVGLIDKFPVEN